MLRLDLIDAEVSGNKWYKLKYNLKKAGELGHHSIITFGGAFSNHIAATAAMAKKTGLKSIGIIRGEDDDSNPTLRKARENGMHLHFISRELYKQKNELHFKAELEMRYGPHYLIPEGGNNFEGVLGCTEILKKEYTHDYILCACGTGTTFAGLAASCNPSTIIVGINVLRGVNEMPNEVTQLLANGNLSLTGKIKGNEAFDEPEIKAHCISNHYCFSGYAGYDEVLVEFKSKFEKRFNIPLDYIYTNKLFYSAFDLIDKKKLKPNSKVLLIHSGGLQGNDGFESRYHLMPTR